MILRRLNNLLHPKIGEVWMLHRVVEHRSIAPNQRTLEVTPDWLEQRILTYRRQGYRFVSMDDIGKTRHWVAVTLDDGYRDNLTVALPLFRKLHIPFCVYVTTGFIDNQQSMWWYPNQSLALDTNELRTLAADPLCTIGAHTVSHPHLSQLPIDAQLHEIQTSQLQLQTILDCPIIHFSYPHGDHNDLTINTCRQLGFHTAVTTNGCTVRNNYKPLQLDRLNVVQPD